MSTTPEIRVMEVSQEDGSVGSQEEGSVGQESRVSETSRTTNAIIVGEEASVSETSGTTSAITRNVRPRLEVIWISDAQDDHNVIPAGYVSTSVAKLSTKKPQRRKTGLQLQLIRVVCGGDNNTTKNSTAYTYYSRKNQNNTAATYHRLFLFRDVLSSTGGVVYMIESKGVNNNLWAKSPQHRDNGVLTIGTCVVILNTLPVDSELAGIPMVACDGGCIILKRPFLFKKVLINSDTRQNDTKSFVYNNLQLDFSYALFSKQNIMGCCVTANAVMRLKQDQKVEVVIPCRHN